MKVKISYRETLIITALTFIIYAIIYSVSWETPGNMNAQGFFGYYDQGQYKLMYESMLHFNFDKGNYAYGIGYPLVALILHPINVLFAPNYFYLMNGIFLVVLALCVYYILRHLQYDPKMSAILAGFTVFVSHTAYYYFVSNNNIVTITAFAYTIYMFVTERSWQKYVGLGFLCGLVLSARYMDILFFLPLLFSLLYVELSNRMTLVKHIVSFVVPFAMWVIITAMYHKVVFGSILTTPYIGHMRFLNGEQFSDLQGFFFGKIPSAMFDIFINPLRALDANDVLNFQPLIYYIPLIPLTILGIGYIIARFGLNRPLMYGLLCSGALTLLVYGSFWAVSGMELKYNCLRYFSFWYPFISLSSILAALSLFDWAMIKTQKIYLWAVVGTVVFTVVLLVFPSLEKVISNAQNISGTVNVASTEKATGLNYLFDHDRHTRFTTNELRKQGQLIMLEFKESTSFSSIVIEDWSDSDYSRSLKFFVSSDGKSFNEITTKKVWFFDRDWHYVFNQTNTKYIKIFNMDTSEDYNWSISELSILK